MKSISLSRKDKKNLIRIIIALGLFVVVFVTDKVIGLGNVFDGKLSWLFPFALYLVVYLIIGYDVLWKAIRNILHGQIFDENFLMCVATLGAFALAIYRGKKSKALMKLVRFYFSTRLENGFKAMLRENLVNPFQN